MPSPNSPLRYPGGKLRLANYLKLVLRENDLLGGVYAEPFAGGAAAGLELLFSEYVEKILINDIDPSVHAFWYSVLNRADEFCEKIEATNVDLDEWRKKRNVLAAKDESDVLELGFAMFYLNRTNRSGILKAGVIGGKHQSGPWKMDARFNKKTLIERIQKIAKYRDRISLSGLDVRQFIKERLSKLPEKSLTYLDPPYFNKGRRLYLNALEPDDHILIKHCIETELPSSWIISYDNSREIRELYKDFRQSVHQIHYSAASSYSGCEVLVFDHNLKIPKQDNPFKITDRELKKVLCSDKRIEHVHASGP